jgi:hypothetical protein
MDHGEKGKSGVDWISLAQDRGSGELLGMQAVINLLVRQNAGKLFEWLHDLWPHK